MKMEFRDGKVYRFGGAGVHIEGFGDPTVLNADIPRGEVAHHITASDEGDGRIIYTVRMPQDAGEISYRTDSMDDALRFARAATCTAAINE